MTHFTLGKPSCICRWRIYNQQLPLENRLLRGLSRRTVNNKPIDKRLVAWAKQHIEWTLVSGSTTYPHGVLMLVIDEKGQAAMSVGPYEPLKQAKLSAFCARAHTAQTEAAETHVAPESLWGVDNNTLLWCAQDDETAGGVNSLVLDLAQTLGIRVVKDANLLNQVQSKQACVSEVFLVSDEHGVVMDEASSSSLVQRLAQSYQKLLQKTQQPTRSSN